MRHFPRGDAATRRGAKLGVHPSSHPSAPARCRNHHVRQPRRHSPQLRDQTSLPTSLSSVVIIPLLPRRAPSTAFSGKCYHEGRSRRVYPPRRRKACEGACGCILWLVWNPRCKHVVYADSDRVGHRSSCRVPWADLTSTVRLRTLTGPYTHLAVTAACPTGDSALLCRTPLTDRPAVPGRRLKNRAAGRGSGPSSLHSRRSCRPCRSCVDRWASHDRL